jgi:L-amino acid N-acyltransferase YncA
MIRPVRKEDAPQIAEIYRPYCEENCVSFEEVAPGTSEVEARIEKITRRLPYLVDDRDGVIAGYAHASPHREKAAYRWAVESTIYVRGDFHGKGVGRGLYTELFNRLRDQGLVKAYAGILVPNPSSQAFHEAMGFTLVGIYRKVGYKLGAWRDVGWWELTLLPQAASPAEPKPPQTSAIKTS